MKHSILRYLTVLIILSISGFRLNAQNTALVLDASSFKPVQQDAITGVSVDKIEKDRSNRECARIKLHLNRMTPEEIAQVGIRALGGNVIVMKKTVAHGGNGIIFEMTARPGVRFYITHPSLGESNTVMVDLEGNREYAMEGWSEQKYSVTIECNRTGAEVYLDGTYRGVIEANGMLTLTEVAVGDHTVKMKDGADEAEQKINVSMNRIYFPVSLESHQQYVVFQVKPLNASVELDGMVLDVVDGAAFANKHFGTYEYTVRAPKHHTYTGSVIVNDLVNKHIVSVDLLPAYGWIEIADNGSSNGADVYLDDEYLGKVPFKSKELASGQHSIRITKPMYKPFQASVSVKDNETTQVVPQLIANFANITLEVADDAEIWVNGTIKGKGRWNGAMTIGPNKVETRKPGHRTQTMSYEVTALMEGQTLTLKTPEAILGTLVVESTPPISDVYIDGKLFSQTPVRTHLPVGAHQVRIARKGYKDYQTSVTITEGQVTTVSHSLEAAAGSQPVKRTEVNPSQGGKESATVPKKGEEIVKIKNIFNIYAVTGKYFLDDAFSSSSPISGWEAGIQIRESIYKRLCIQTGLAYNTFTTANGVDGITDYTELTLHSLKLPLQLYIGFPFAKRCWMQFEAGGYASYAIDGKICQKLRNTMGDTISTGVSPLYTSDKTMNPFNRFDAGLQFGITVKIYGIGISATYTHGLIDLSKSPQISAQTRSYGFGLSYSLGIIRYHLRKIL